jgi:hypothetical protein
MLEAKPLHLKEANAFIASHHQHSIPTVGCKFAIAAIDADRIVGVAVAGRPIARMADDGFTLEILRVCTDGTRNANSFLYSRVARIARLMGYRQVITYTLDHESGSSLRACGAKPTACGRAGEWNCKSRPRKSQPVYSQEKIRWELMDTFSLRVDGDGRHSRA